MIKEISFSALAKMTGIASQYIIIALLSRRLSSYEFGVWMVFFHLMITLSICDFGMGGGGLRNELTKLHAQKEPPCVQKDLFFASVVVIGCIALILFGCNCLLAKYSMIILFQDMMAFQHIAWLFFLFLFFMFLKIPFSLYASGFYAYQEVSYKAVLDCIEAVVLTALVASFFWIKGTFLQLFFCYYLVMLLIHMIGFGWFLKRRCWTWSPVTFTSLRKVFTTLLKTNLLFWLQNVVSIALFSSAPILINILGGVVIAGEYSLIYRLYSLFIGIHFAMLNPLWSCYADAFYQGKYNLMRQKHERTLFATGVALSTAAIGVILLYKPLIYLWTGKRIEALSLVALSGVWMLLYGMTNCYSVFLNAMNSIRRQVVFLSLGACLNLFFGMILGRSLGAIGVVIAAIIALLPLLFSNILEVICLRHKDRI